MIAVNFLIWGLSAFVSSFLLVACIRNWALRRNLLDLPNERSSHTIPTPRGGGLAIVMVVLAGLTIILLGDNELPIFSLAVYLIPALVIAAIGWFDDLIKISAIARLLVQLVAALVFIMSAGFVDRVYLPFLGIGNWELGIWNFGVFLTLLWLVGFTNAFNFMDGVDGIAASQAIVAGIFWFLVSVTLDLPALASLSILVASASLGFLLHNTPPARIFMGDAGSTLLGFTLAAIPVLAFGATGNPRMPVAGVLCVAPFVFDTALTMFRRLLNRENVLQAHHSHLYQRLVALGFRHGQVTILYTVLASFTSLMAWVYLWNDGEAGGWALFLSCLVLFVTAGWITRLELKHKDGTKKGIGCEEQS